MILEASPEVVEALALDREEGRTERLWAKEQWTAFAVYRVRADHLHPNPGNRRFRAERQSIERELGRPLDPTIHPEDVDAVIALALDREPRLNERGQVVGKRNPDTASLADDWRKRHQESPLWIRPSGLIVNGNRRWAMLRRLQQDGESAGVHYVDVIVLGPQFEGPELFHMEAREQLTEGLKVRYGDVNLLLTLREAADLEGVDWGDSADVARVARAIRSLARNDHRYALLQLTAVKYMTDYLIEIDAPDDFRRMDRRVERFRDVARNMMKVQALDAVREPKMLELCFAAVRANNPHDDLRELRRILVDQPELFDTLYLQVTEALDEVGGIRPEPEPEPSAGVPDPDLEVDDDEDEDEDEDEDGTDPEAYIGVQQLISVQVQAASTNRESAAKSVRLAEALLAQISPDVLETALAADERGRTRTAVEAIIAWAQTAEGQLDRLGE